MLKKVFFVLFALAFLYACGQIGQSDYHSLSEDSVVAVVRSQDSHGCTTVETPDGELWEYYDCDDLVRGDKVLITITDDEIVYSELLE